MQHQIYWGPLKKPIEWSLKTLLAPWAYMASVVYHDSFWYPLKARTHDGAGAGSRVGPPVPQLGAAHARQPTASPPWATTAPSLSASACKAFTKSLGILGTCMKEAPEFGRHRRRVVAAKAAR